MAIPHNLSDLERASRLLSQQLPQIALLDISSNHYLSENYHWCQESNLLWAYTERTIEWNPSWNDSKVQQWTKKLDSEDLRRDWFAHIVIQGDEVRVSKSLFVANTALASKMTSRIALGIYFMVLYVKKPRSQKTRRKSSWNESHIREQIKHDNGELAYYFLKSAHLHLHSQPKHVIGYKWYVGHIPYVCLTHSSTVLKRLV